MNRQVDIGDIVGTVIQDGILMYKVFNGYHHEHPVYWYRPVNNMTPKNAS